MERRQLEREVREVVKGEGFVVASEADELRLQLTAKHIPDEAIVASLTF